MELKSTVRIDLASQTIAYNIQSSSLPSVQSWVPSQRPAERIHWPLLHRNAPLLQESMYVEITLQTLIELQILYVHNIDCICE